MGLKGIAITLIAIVSLVFAVVNWNTLIADAPVSLLFETYNLPIGLILLLVVVVLSSLFFIGSLVDRASQLRQITQLERNLERLQTKLSKRQQDEVAELDQHLSTQLENLVGQLSDSAVRLEQTTKASLNEFEAHTLEQFERIEDRVLLVRNELAADIGVLQDSIEREKERV